MLVPAPSRATTLVKKNVSLIRRFIKANKAGGGITGMALTAAAGGLHPRVPSCPVLRCMCQQLAAHVLGM